MTSKIDYNKIANTLIARFDDEVTGEIHAKLVSVLSKREREIYFGLTYVLNTKSTVITTKLSREIKREREDISKLFV